MPKIEIIAGGIFGAAKELAIGEKHDVDHIPPGWVDKVRVIGDEDGKVGLTNPEKHEADIAEMQAGFDKSYGDLMGRFNEVSAERDSLLQTVADLGAQIDALTAQSGTQPQESTDAKGKIEARDTGSGWWAIFDAEGNEVGKKIRKDEAEAFNAFSDAEKVEYLKTE